MTSPPKERLYKTIPRNIVYSRWLVTQAVVLPDIDIEIPDDRSVAPSVHTQVQRLLATHGGLDRIISRSTTPSGKVTFNVKWKDGAETQERAHILHEIDATALEAYQHQKISAQDGSSSENDNALILSTNNVVDHDSDSSYNEGEASSTSKRSSPPPPTVPFYNSDTLSSHSLHCSQCKKQGYPNEPERPRRSTSAEEEEDQGRLLLCTTCSAATHEKCCSPDQLIQPATNGETLVEFRCSDCFNHDNATCNKCQTTRDDDDDQFCCLFRCSKCKRCFHFDCLSRVPDDEEETRTTCMQHQQCPQCIDFTGKAEKILAWRLADLQQRRQAGNRPLKEVTLTRKEFLVKWLDMSYRHVAWLPEDWLMATHETLHEGYLSQHADDFPLLCNGELVPIQWMTITRIMDAQDENGNKVQADSSNSVHRVFAQFGGPADDQAYWDTPPSSKDSNLYPAYIDALDRYWQQQQQQQQQDTSSSHEEEQEALAASEDPSSSVDQQQQQQQPAYISGGTLMSHQLEGLKWLLYKWDLRQSCVLADDKGLGKTTQVVSFLNHILTELDVHPFLVVTPSKSHVEHWIRELKKWSPAMIALPYCLSEVTQQLELDLKSLQNKERCTKEPKCDVVIATRDALLSNMGIFKRIEFAVLVVDQAHQVTSSLYRELRNLHYFRSILMADTLREKGARGLAEIMHFIDPIRFRSVRGPQRFYGFASQDPLQILLEQFQPYYLRRTKELFLQTLPPKSELIVPVTMTSFQRQVCQMILEDHVVKYTLAGSSNQSTSHLHNALMLLRDTLNHPCLIPLMVSHDTTPKNHPCHMPGIDADQETQQGFIHASPKLTLFHQMLPKLLENNHRVLVLSAYKSTLDILERYFSFNNNSIEYLRMDEETPTHDRIKRVDAFNSNESTANVFLMTTICARFNMMTADTLILWDMDHDPHVMMRAVDHVYCIGQAKPVAVFKFMMRSTAEEKIALIAKRNFVLGKMDDDRGILLQEQEIKHILKFGVAGLFEDDHASKAIHYDDHAIDKLLDRSDLVDEPMSDNQAMNDFSLALSHINPRSSMFAKVWQMDTRGNVIKEELTEGNTRRDDAFWERLVLEKRKQMDGEEQPQEQQQQPRNGILKRKDHMEPSSSSSSSSEDKPANKKPKPTLHAERQQQQLVSPPSSSSSKGTNAVFHPHHRPTLGINKYPLETQKQQKQQPKVTVVSKQLKALNSRMGKRNTPPPLRRPPTRPQQSDKGDGFHGAALLVRRLNYRLQGLPALTSRVERTAHGGGAATQNKKDVNAAKRLHDLRTKLQPDL